MQARVTVNDVHCRRGVRRAPDCCPLALAGMEALTPLVPALAFVETVCEFMVLHLKGGATISLDIPEAARAFLYRYDSTGDAAPFSFVLDVPDDLCRPVPA